MLVRGIDAFRKASIHSRCGLGDMDHSELQGHLGFAREPFLSAWRDLSAL